MGRLDLPDPVRDEDIFVESALDAGGHLADEVAAVLLTRPTELGLAATLVSNDSALD